MGTWLEEDHIYKPQERPLEKEGNAYIVEGKRYEANEVSKDAFGTLLVAGKNGEKEAIRYRGRRQDHGGLPYT